MILHSAKAGKSLETTSITLLVIGPEGLDALNTILHRALNCWAEAPREFFELADELKRVHPEAKLLSFNPPNSPRQRADDPYDLNKAGLFPRQRAY